MTKRFFIIDGNSYCYRAYFAVRYLSNTKGQPTNAVFGFISMLQKLINDEAPDYLALTFDLKGPTFRHAEYEDYKAQRKPMEDDLVSQVPIIKDVVRAMRIPIFEVEGYEADDVMATIATKLKKKDIDVYLVTGDKDIFQMVNNKDKVFVYHAHKDGRVYDEKGVKDYFGVAPNQVTDMIGLAGDSSDNLPGIPGIGPKTATELLDKFSSIESLYKHINEISSPRRRDLIAKHQKDAQMCKKLATLKKDVPLEFKLSETKLSKPDQDALAQLYKELEFNSFLKNLDLKPTRISYKRHLINTRKDFEDFVKKLKKQKKFAFDFETTSIDAVACEPVGISFCFNDKDSYYIPVRISSKSDILFDKGKLDPDYVFGLLRDIFESDAAVKIGHNIKYELLVLATLGIDVQGRIQDTMVASYLINPERGSHSLSALTMEHYGYQMTDITELIGTGKKAITMNEVALEKIVPYACDDSYFTFKLGGDLLAALARANMTELYEKVELPLIKVLADIEYAGVNIDAKYLKELSDYFAKNIDYLQREIYRISDESFNINSTKQLSEILFTKLSYPVIKKTKTGYSTDEEVLKTLAADYPICENILKYRELVKLKSTYSDSLPSLINPATGRLHASFNQSVTATGRLSSSNPNLQNIPVRREEGRKIRKAFIARDSKHILISADYSQIELRILAHYAKDKGLIEAFKKDKDIHSYTASLIFDTKEGSVDASMRNVAKTVNFGIMYGMGAFGLSKDLGISVDEAKQFIEQYFKRYPGVQKYMTEQVKLAQKNGYVETLMRRRRYIGDITSSNARLRHFGERAAINAPIQGSAADLIKLAMIRLNDTLHAEGYASKMILQVHDELILDCPKKEVEDVVECVSRIMEGAMDIAVPLVVNVKTGSNWAEMKPHKVSVKS